MSILFEPTIAHFGKAKHSLDDPDRMLDFGPYLRFGAVFRAFDLIHNTAMAIAPVDEVFRSRCVLTDYCPLAAIRLIAPHAGFVSVQQIGQHRAVGDTPSVPRINEVPKKMKTFPPRYRGFLEKRYGPVVMR